MFDIILLPKPAHVATLEPKNIEYKSRRKNSKKNNLARRHTLPGGVSRKMYGPKSMPLPLLATSRLDPSRAPILFHMPISSDDSLCRELADQLDQLHLTASWFTLIPSRLGRSRAVDDATEALIQAHRFSFQTQSVSADNCLRSYTKAISSLQRLISMSQDCTSDDALLTCAILAQFERTMGFQSEQKSNPIKRTLTHLRGVEAIILSRPQDHELSGLAKSILSGSLVILFEMPVALGCSSPFERLAPLDLESARPEVKSSYISRLRNTGYTLRVHLPRLIMHMRTRRTLRETGAHAESNVSEAAMTLARSLFALEDEEAESALLHSVKVKKTKDLLLMTRNSPCAIGALSADAVMMRYSLDFMSLVEFEAALYYWHSRTLILRLCWRIGPSDSYDYDALATEGRRTAQNIMMTWQYGLEHGLFGRICLLHAVPALWGAITDFGSTV